MIGNWKKRGEKWWLCSIRNFRYGKDCWISCSCSNCWSSVCIFFYNALIKEERTLLCSHIPDNDNAKIYDDYMSCFEILEILQLREEGWQFKKVNFWVVIWNILTWSKVLILPFFKRYSDYFCCHTKDNSGRATQSSLLSIYVLFNHSDRPKTIHLVLNWLRIKKPVCTEEMIHTRNMWYLSQILYYTFIISICWNICKCIPKNYFNFF